MRAQVTLFSLCLNRVAYYTLVFVLFVRFKAGKKLLAFDFSPMGSLLLLQTWHLEMITGPERDVQTHAALLTRRLKRDFEMSNC